MNSVKIAKLKTQPIWIIACVSIYGAKNSDCQIKSSPIPTESQFAKFNVRQVFLLYGNIIIPLLPDLILA